MTQRQQQVQKLLDQAMKQPGVADLMQLYEAQKAAIEAHAEAEAAVAPRWVAFTSSSSSRTK